MKYILFFLAFTFLLSTLSLSAFSEESKVCDKTLKIICSKTEGQRIEAESYLNGFRTEIAKKSNKKVSNKTNLKIQSAKTIVNKMHALITSSENVSIYKNYMYQAIDETNFDEVTRFKFKESIESVLIGNYSDFYESNDERFKDLKTAGKFLCGIDGMQINAFSDRIYNQKYVFFCPGFLIDLSRLPTDEEKINAMLHMISHELGHHIDTKLIGEKLYMPYLSCLSENYSSQFMKTNEDKIFCNLNSTTQESCNMQTTKSHAKELIADQWAIKVMAIHARKQKYSLKQADLFLQRNFVNICDTVTEGIHPTGDFRIETLLRINPETSDYLSCNNSGVKKPACTFDGEVVL